MGMTAVRVLPAQGEQGRVASQHACTSAAYGGLGFVGYMPQQSKAWPVDLATCTAQHMNNSLHNNPTRSPARNHSAATHSSKYTQPTQQNTAPTAGPNSKTTLTDTSQEQAGHAASNRHSPTSQLQSAKPQPTGMHHHTMQTPLHQLPTGATLSNRLVTALTVSGWCVSM